MRESWNSRLSRWMFNWWPCYRGTGGRVTFISADWRTLRIRLPLNLRTRNYVGTIFGGSLYAAVDPFFMLMLMKNLGPGTTVWDKAAQIRFRRPGRSLLTAEFRLEEEELQMIRTLLATQPKVDRTYTVSLVDATGEVHAVVEKTIHLARKA
jgi:acyl-coenzyme A thioesterase PaaI-like protein